MLLFVKGSMMSLRNYRYQVGESVKLEFLQFILSGKMKVLFVINKTVD